MDTRIRLAVLALLATAIASPGVGQAQPPTSAPATTKQAAESLARLVPTIFDQAVKDHSAATEQLKNANPGEVLHISFGGHFIPWMLHHRDGKVLNRCRTLDDFVSKCWTAKAQGRASELVDNLRAATDYLKRDDARYRAVACEFLAYFPLEGIDLGLTPVLGKLLDDGAKAFDGVSFQYEHSNLTRLADGVQVKDVARTAVQQMTTLDFPDRKTFEAWWAKNSDYRERLWYWSVRWGVQYRDREKTTAADIATMKPADALRLLLLAGNSVAKVVDAGLPAAACEGGKDDLPVREAFHYEPDVTPAMTAAFIRAHAFKPVIMAALRQDPPWAQARSPDAVQGLFRKLQPILPLVLDAADAPEIEKILDKSEGCLAGAADLQSGLAKAVVLMVPDRAEKVLLAQLKRNPRQPDLVVALIHQTGLKHWPMIHTLCNGAEKKTVLEALAKMKTPQAAAAIVQWLSDQDWKPMLNDRGYEDDATVQLLLLSFVRAAVTIGQVDPDVQMDFYHAEERAKWVVDRTSPEDSREANKAVAVAQARIIRELKKFFAAAATSPTSQPDDPPGEALPSSPASQPDGTPWPRTVTVNRLADGQSELVIRNIYHNDLAAGQNHTSCPVEGEDGKDLRGEMFRTQGQARSVSFRCVTTQPIRDLPKWCDRNGHWGGSIPYWEELLLRDRRSPRYQPGLFRLAARIVDDQFWNADVALRRDTHLSLLKAEALDRAARLTYFDNCFNDKTTYIKRFRITWRDGRYRFQDELKPEQVATDALATLLFRRLPTEMPIRYGAGAEGTVRITRTTAHCMATDCHALRIFDKAGQFLWEEQRDLNDYVVPLVADLKGDGTQQVLACIEDHGALGILIYEAAEAPAATSQPDALLPAAPPPATQRDGAAWREQRLGKAPTGRWVAVSLDGLHVAEIDFDPQKKRLGHLRGRPAEGEVAWRRAGQVAG